MSFNYTGLVQWRTFLNFVGLKNKLQDREFIHPSIDSFIDETQGIIVYQEQVMEIARKMSGYTLGQADLLRRAMGKR